MSLDYGQDMCYGVDMAQRRFHLVKGSKRDRNGNVCDFWILRESVYVPLAQAMKPVYVAYVGVEKVLSKTKALKICQDHDIEYATLKAVNGLSIVPDDEFERRRLARRAAQKDARALAKAKKQGVIGQREKSDDANCGKKS